MANLLTITKNTNYFFTFLVNGQSAKAIKNTRNDLTMYGNEAHFKTSNGANLIKEQNILFGNITIINGASSLVPTSPDDLFTKLISVNFFDWISPAGSGGVNRFDALVDTFSYFGKDGQSIRVNEAQLKLESFNLPDTSYLNKFPNTLSPLKILRVKADNSGYELITMPTFGIANSIDYVKLTIANSNFIIPDSVTALWAVVNDRVWNRATSNNSLEPNTFTQSGTTVTFKTALEINNYVVIFYQ